MVPVELKELPHRLQARARRRRRGSDLHGRGPEPAVAISAAVLSRRRNGIGRAILGDDLAFALGAAYRHRARLRASTADRSAVRFFMRACCGQRDGVRSPRHSNTRYWLSPFSAIFQPRARCDRRRHIRADLFECFAPSPPVRVAIPGGVVPGQLQTHLRGRSKSIKRSRYNGLCSCRNTRHARPAVTVVRPMGNVASITATAGPRARVPMGGMADNGPRQRARDRHRHRKPGISGTATQAGELGLQPAIPAPMSISPARQFLAQPCSSRKVSMFKPAAGLRSMLRHTAGPPRPFHRPPYAIAPWGN